MPQDDFSYLQKHREIWRQKPVLRKLYGEQFYQRLLDHSVAGNIALEIGSGPGFMAEFAPHVWRTDILPSPYIHSAADAHRMPFGTERFDNIYGLDVLHHFNKPIHVLKEMARLLRPGGRLILVEPWITPISRFIYTYLHQEDCDLSVQPWVMEAAQFDPDKNAFDGNAAIPYLLVKRSGTALQDHLPELNLVKLETFSSLTYLLSGGFKPTSILPAFLYTPLYQIEKLTSPIWRNIAALRALIVWQKTT